MAETRVIRKGFVDSDKVNSLSWFAECLYHRLLLVADDYGLFDARLAYLRSQLFGLKLDAVREADLQRALADVERAGLVRFYHVDGKPFLQLLNYGQRTQSQPRFPLPPDMASAEVRGGSRCVTVNHGLVGGGVGVDNRNEGLGSSPLLQGAPQGADAARTAAAPLPRLSDEDSALLASEEFAAWHESLKAALPPLARLRAIPADARAAALDAFRCVPDAAGLEVQPKLRRYYAAKKADIEYRGVKVYRPTGVRSLFAALHDIVEYAMEFCNREDVARAALERRRKAEAATKQVPQGSGEEMTAEECAAFFRDVRGEKPEDQN